MCPKKLPFGFLKSASCVYYNPLVICPKSKSINAYYYRIAIHRVLHTLTPYIKDTIRNNQIAAAGFERLVDSNAVENLVMKISVKCYLYF